MSFAEEFDNADDDDEGEAQRQSITTSDLYVTDLELPCYRTHLDSLREKGSNVTVCLLSLELGGLGELG
jgi:hypothetical protein